MFKRILSFMLVLAMLLSYTACGSDSSSDIATISSSDISISSEESEDISSEITESNQDENAESQSVTGTQTANTQGSFYITKQPINTSVNIGETITLTLTASEAGLSYQWYTSLSPNGEDAIKLNGQTESSLAIHTSNSFVQYYYCVISKAGTNTQIKSNIVTASANGSSVGATTTFSDSPNITVQPQSAIYTINTTATSLSVTASIPSGNGSLSYAWYKGTPASGTATIVGTNSTYIPPVNAVGTESYYCAVTNTLANGNSYTKNSSISTITVNDIIYDIWVKGIQVTESNASDVLSDGGKVSFNSKSNILSLNGVDISHDGTTKNNLIHSELISPLTIKLTNNNKLHNSADGDNFGVIYSQNSSLTINGAGSLIATTASLDGRTSTVITSKKDLTFEGSATITATSGDSSIFFAAPVITADGNLAIKDNVYLTSTSGVGDSGSGAGIFSLQNITISDNPTIVTKSSYSLLSHLDGLRAYGKVYILGGDITCEGAYGIYTNDSIYIKDATVNIIGHTQTSIRSDGNLTIDGGNITFKCVKDDFTGSNLHIDGTTTFNGGTIIIDNTEIATSNSTLFKNLPAASQYMQFGADFKIGANSSNLTTLHDTSELTDSAIKYFIITPK